MTAGINTKPPIGQLRHGPRPKDHEEIPLQSLVKTPTGREAKVIAYRGPRGKGHSGPGYKGSARGHRVWLVCQYLDPINRKFDFVLVLPELVTVIRLGPAAEAA